MKTDRFYSMLGVLAIAAGIFGTVSCEKNPQGAAKDYVLELANPADAEIFVNNGNTASINVELVLKNITKEEISINAKENEGSWCAAEISTEADAVTITPGANATAEDKVAVFEVSAANVEPVVIKVTSTGSETEIFVEVESAQVSVDSYGMLTFNPSAAGESLTVTVRTNAERWYLNDMNMVTDDDYNPVEWYTADKTSGKNGETCTITFSANTGTEDRMASLMFVEEPEGYGYGASSVMVTQSGKPATAVSVTYYDENWSEVTVDGKTFDVAFDKDASTWDGFDFELEKDGSVIFLFVNPGTMDANTSIEGADDPWVSISASYGYSIVPTANSTGATRSTDLVICPAGDKATELFRFRITQAGE